MFPRSPLFVPFLFAALFSSCSVPGASAAAAQRNLFEDEEIFGSMLPEQVLQIRDKLAQTELPANYPPDQDEEGAPEGPPFIEPKGDEPLLFSENAMHRLVDIASKNHTGFKRGAHSLMVGLLASLSFFLLHVMTQYVNDKSIKEDVFIREGSGRMTFTGAGLMLGLSALSAGVTELIISVLTKGENAFFWPMLNTLLMEIGRSIYLAGSAGIIFGYILGFSPAVMGTAASVFVAGMGVALIGLVYMFRDGARALKLAKRIYIPGDKAALSVNSADNSVDALFNRLLLYNFQEFIHHQEAEGKQETEENKQTENKQEGNNTDNNEDNLNNNEDNLNNNEHNQNNNENNQTEEKETKEEPSEQPEQHANAEETEALSAAAEEENSEE